MNRFPPVFISNRPVYVIGQDEKVPFADVVIRLSGNEPEGFLKPMLRSFEENRLASALVFSSPDPALVFEQMLAGYRVIEAAGGIVISPNGRLLMIYRNGLWDLPKGKLEPGEDPAAAGLREVEEECGVSGLSLRGETEFTYHTYAYRDEAVVKRTVWYLMDAEEENEGTPQTEEGITEVCWMNRTAAREALQSGFASIRIAVEPYWELLRD
ncbi:MAG: NUDIX domain-containing protein [Sphingobacteriales bacterium]|jgi:8-oxo-dGTP pyrophosphatase MutT (NUDIX family)|nr:NUDIX domain-containing protein [Sphingobacteriales bacterium]